MSATKQFANPARNVREMRLLFINDMRARSPGVASALSNDTSVTARSRIKKNPCHKSDNVMPIDMLFTSARLSTAMVGWVIPSVTQLVVLLTVSPYLPLVYCTTGMANLKISTASISDINYNEYKTVYRNFEQGLQCKES